MTPLAPRTPSPSIDARAFADLTFEVMVRGDVDDFRRVFHPDAVNREAIAEPPAARQPGPDGFHATALWLRGMFADLAFETHEVAVGGELIVVYTTMSGRHTGDAVMYAPDATVAQVFPATGRMFATTQTHWYRLSGGTVIEHWANRDDQGTAMQLGWAPPPPWYLLRMHLATRRVRRS